VGGTLFAVLIGVWYTSAVWLYTRDTAVSASANARAGATVFAETGCGACHTLAAAGASGDVGPSTSSGRPTRTSAAKFESGGGVMPAYKGDLSAQQIRDVAAFVAMRAGSP
jgi:mono/diheme cytochrome c family protein